MRLESYLYELKLKNCAIKSIKGAVSTLLVIILEQENACFVTFLALFTFLLSLPLSLLLSFHGIKEVTVCFGGFETIM